MKKSIRIFSIIVLMLCLGTLLFVSCSKWNNGNPNPKIAKEEIPEVEIRDPKFEEKEIYKNTIAILEKNKLVVAIENKGKIENKICYKDGELIKIFSATDKVEDGFVCYAYHDTKEEKYFVKKDNISNEYKTYETKKDIDKFLLSNEELNYTSLIQCLKNLFTRIDELCKEKEYDETRKQFEFNLASYPFYVGGESKVVSKFNTRLSEKHSNAFADIQKVIVKESGITIEYEVTGYMRDGEYIPSEREELGTVTVLFEDFDESRPEGI